ncbi:MAG: NUDIX domain-containing protein [Pseudomonadota bacterium]
MDKAVEVLASDELHEDFLKLRRYRLRHRRYDGDWSAAIARERVEGLQAAGALLYDPVADAVVLVEQFRIGAMDPADPANAWVLETVGGYIPPGQNPEAVARWEVQEETGCEVGRLEAICTFYVSPGFSTERIHLFCGEVDSATAGGVHGVAAEGEDILVRVLGCDEAFSLLARGAINTTSAIVALQWLQLNREHLRRRWR